MNKSKAKIVIVFSILMITLIAGVVFASSPEQQAVAVANELFINEGKGTLTEVGDTLGFNSPAEVNKAYLGDPIPVYLIGDSISVNESLTDQISPTPSYIFPIYANGRCVTEMEVKLRDGNWVFGSLGGHKAAYLNKLASANNIEPSDFKIIRFGFKTSFVALKDGKEIGATYQKNSKDFAMSEQKITLFKDEVKLFTDTINDNSDSDSVIIKGQSNDLAYSFEQKDSVFERISRYVHYLINN